MADFSFNGMDLTSEGRKFIAELNKLQRMEVHVGFQSGEVSYEGGADLVEIAAYNEYGTSETPARPFMQQSWENHEDELKQLCQQAYNIVTNGGTAEEACRVIGVAGVGIIQKEIVEGSFEPNAESTIRKKGSDRPLIDTGQMRQSVKYVVKEG